MKEWQRKLIENPSSYVLSMFSTEEWECIVMNELEEPTFGGPSIYQNDLYKQCMLDLYGVENPMHHPDFVRKNKESYVSTCIERYGVRNSSINPEIKNKISRSVSKYHQENDDYGYGRGDYNIMKKPEVREKNKQTCFKKYGFQRASENEDVKKKIGAKSSERTSRPIVEEIKHLKQKYGFKLPRSWNHTNTELLELLRDEINDKYK